MPDLHVADCPKTNSPPDEPCVCEHWAGEARDFLEGGGGQRACHHGRRRPDCSACDDEEDQAHRGEALALRGSFAYEYEVDERQLDGSVRRVRRRAAG